MGFSIPRECLLQARIVEKRLVLFIVLSSALLLGHALLVQYLNPPKPKARRVATTPARTNGDAEDEAPPEPRDDPDPAPNAKPEADEAAVSTVVAPASQRFALGSAAPGSPYRLLVVLNSQGASIESIELTARKPNGKWVYRDLEHEWGYLGPLGCAIEPRGCRVQFVVAGTPADMATTADGAGGLNPGDLITEIDGDPVGEGRLVEDALQSTKPGQKITLTVESGAGSSSLVRRLQVTLSERPLHVVKPERSNPKVSGNFDPYSLLTTINRIDDDEIPAGRDGVAGFGQPQKLDWTATVLDGEHPGVEFRLTIPATQLAAVGLKGAFELVKRYRLASVPNSQPDASFPAYHLELDIGLRNLDSRPHEVAYRVDGFNGLPLEGWWYSSKMHPRMFRSAGARDVTWKGVREVQHLLGAGDVVAAAKTADKKNLKSIETPFFSGTPKSLEYVAVDTKYFAAAIIPRADDPLPVMGIEQGAALPLGNWRAVTHDRRTTNTSFWLAVPAGKIDPGEMVEHHYTLFAGPKSRDLLGHYRLETLVYYGWQIFELFARALELLLHMFYRLVRNYGVAVILLTVLVRSLMFPLSRMAARNAARMQELQPQMKEITERHKEDMEKRNAAMWELYRKHNFHPLSGCVPAFVQLPVFIGLYRCFSIDIMARDTPLIPGWRWCSDLAAPDKLFRWDWLPEFLSGAGTGYLGPYCNVLPMFTIALFLVQQKLFTPPPADEQQQMQQSMMKWMMVFMCVMFFKVPAGLCIYFIASSLWSIGERLLVPKSKATATAVTVVAPAASSPERATAARSKADPSGVMALIARLGKIFGAAPNQNGTPTARGKRKQRRRP